MRASAVAFAIAIAFALTAAQALGQAGQGARACYPLGEEGERRVRSDLARSEGRGGGEGRGGQDPGIIARTAEAERAVATQELADGRPFAAIDRLERALGPGGATQGAAQGAALPGTAAALATLALAYERVGCKAAFVAVAERALGAAVGDTLAGAVAAELRSRLALVKGMAADSVPARDVPAVRPDSTPAQASLDSAWVAYSAGRFAEAAAGFGRVAGATPGLADRLDTRLLEGQALLESRSTARATAIYEAALDSARSLAATLDARLAADPAGAAGGAGSRGAAQATAAFGRAAAASRALGVLWAPDTRSGRLVAEAPGAPPESAMAASAGPDSTAGSMRVQRVVASDIVAAMAAMGAPAAEPAAHALAWTSGAGGLAAVRALADTLREADARGARAAARVEQVKADRPIRLGDAARHVATVRRMADTLTAAEAVLKAIGDSVARRDTAIARTIAQYRALIVAKVAETQQIAAQNRIQLQGIAAAAQRMGEVTTQFLASEEQTVTAYVAAAGAVASALERGLTRLDIVIQRDTIHRKYERLTASLVAARVAYDSALAPALAAERSVVAAADATLGAAQGELLASRSWLDSVEARAGVAASVALESRVPALRQRLGRITHAGTYGLAVARFFATIEADTLRAAVADVSRRREAAIAALTNAVTSLAESPLKPVALLQLGELLARNADAEFAASQRAGGSGAHPDYAPAIGRFDELLKQYPGDPRADVAAYTLGTLAFGMQRYDDANSAFALVTAKENSPFRAEAYFRGGDGRFELAAKLAGEPRRLAFADAAASYARAIALAQAGGDIYFLALYKLGWSEYMQAERQSSDEYRRAVDAFARLVREVDSLPPERQARLALRQEAIDYLAIAITQLGGAEEAVKYLGTIPDIGTRMLVLRRVAHALRDQGEFNAAVIAFRGALDQAPTHASALETHTELVDLFQSRMLEPLRAQDARLEAVDALEPAGAWGAANTARAADAAMLRERMLREAGSFALSEARKGVSGAPGRGGRATSEGRSGQGRGARATASPFGGILVIATTAEARQMHDVAADLFARYLAEFSSSDSAQRVSLLEGDARFGARDWFASGAAYSRTATKWGAAAPGGNAANPGNPANPADPGDATSAVSAAARRNAVVAFDSALAAERRTPGRDPERQRAVEDSLFAATERFAASAPPDDARPALVAMGRRASEGQRWDVVADVFTRVADRWPSDAFAPDARKFVGDARYRQGRYTDAQAEWRRAQAAATQASRRAFADSIVSARIAAASQAADSLSKRNDFVTAADSVLGALAGELTDPTRAADLLRNAIEVHLDGDSASRARGDTAGARAAREHAITAVEALAARFPAYRHTLTYAALRARLLSDVGRAADAASALQSLAQANPAWPGRSDAMVRAAVILDSIGQAEASAAAFERFSATYPAERRAPDAQYNAAVILRDAKDHAGAARAFQAFAVRFPRDPRVGDALVGRVTALRASGDSSTVGAELARFCARTSAAPAGGAAPATATTTALAATCADRAGALAFREGMARWDSYVALQLEIKTRAQLTRTGVEQASLPKLQALRAMTRSFTRAIASGAPEWVGAGSFQTGLAQWQYGIFLRDVVLPADITDAQRTGAQTGSAQQAQQYFDSAIKAWSALVEKAAADKFENTWVEKARAALRGEGIPARERSAP